MSKKWEIKEVSTPERIFSKIKEEMAQPVGIVLFGADCDFKNEVENEVCRQLQGFARYYNYRSIISDNAKLKRAVEKFSSVVIILDTEQSASDDCRRTLVTKLRESGAQQVIGIFVKADKRPIGPFGSIGLMMKTAWYNNSVSTIEQCRWEDFDGQITVEEATRLWSTAVAKEG